MADIYNLFSCCTGKNNIVVKQAQLNVELDNNQLFDLNSNNTNNTLSISSLSNNPFYIKRNELNNDKKESDNNNNNNNNTNNENQNEENIINNENQNEQDASPRFNNATNEIVDTNIVDPNNNSSTKKKGTNYSIITFSNQNIFSSANNSNNQINSEHQKSNKLLLSGDLFFNKEILVTSQGMVNGLRKKNDGQTFFGISNSKDCKGTYYNDMVINFPFSQQNNCSTGRIFDISFQKNSNDYKLFMMHKNLIINYQVENIFYFEEDKDYYFLLGKAFITITPFCKKLKPIHIDVQVEVDNDNNTYTFNIDNMPVNMGRTNCEIIIHHSSISKKHAVIGYNNELKMFYFKDLNSTNGSILIIKEEDSVKLKGDCRFKLENVSFRILELP